ncbi:MAG: NAD(P)H-dependent oxidoreductase [Candidatus Marithrix sp.]|nr:NAD(P)H-dependent oxidoreductase [Candidatus Marithrix sp.]
MNVLAQATRFKADMLEPYILIAILILIINLAVAFVLKKNDYFALGVSGVALIGFVSVVIFPNVGQFYLEHIIEGLYFGLFLMATLPLIFKIKSFTFFISAKNYPHVIVKSNNFLKINNLMSAIWAFLFVLGIIFTTISYSNDMVIQTIIATLIPIIILIIVGIPLNKYLPDYLMQHAPGERIIFSSLAEAGEAMPYGLSKELSKGLDTIIQFELTGKEAGIAHVIIKEQKCEFKQEPHPNPNTIIKADSKIWLEIVNNELSGDKAFLNNMFEVKGDATILLIFSDLFAPKNLQDVAQYKPRKIDYNYKTFEPNKIKNIVVFDGGPRNKKFSKTTFMVDKFIDGAKSVGAEVDYYKLSKLNIHHCNGCYTCWTKTPGECIHKDDMTELRNKYREADLVIFASPLYIFNVTGILKTFMDRLLPILKPYMLLDEKGYIKHPDRFPEKGEQGFIVFSASGFPDVEHNFDGLKGMFRLWDSHNENTHLMGEFYMPAAEMIVQPVYEKRRKIIEIACFNAGKDAVEKGIIDKQYMQAVSFPSVTRTKFQKQADYFWETLDDKGLYLKKVPKLNT